MTIELFCGKLRGRSWTCAGESMHWMSRFAMWVFVGALGAAPALSQSLLGTFTAAGEQSGVPIALNVSVSGGRISGVMGTGQPGANPPVVAAASMVTQVQGTATGGEWVVRAGMFTMTGNFNGTTYSGSYAVGSQSGVFSLSTGAAATNAARGAAPPANGVVSWLAAPQGAAAAPVAAPAAAAKPVAAAAAPRAANPVGGAAPPPAIAANGVVGWLAAPPQAQPPPPVVVPWLAATNGPAQGVTPNGAGQQAAVPPVPAPVPKWNPPLPVPPPVPVPPVPPVGGMTCPTSGTAQTYRGIVYAGGSREAVTFNLVFGGGAVSGTMGLAQDGTIAAAPNRVTGTLNGQHCRLTPGGLDQGAVFDGTCDGRTFNGTKSQQGTNYAFTTSLVAGGANAVTTQCGGTVVPPVPVPPAPPVKPMCTAAGTGPQMYQGTFYADSVESIFFNLTFQGASISGSTGSTDPGTPFLNVYPLTGTRAGQSCSVTTRGGAVFQGTCDGQNFNGTTKTTDGVMRFVTSCGGAFPPAPKPVPTPAPVTCSAAQLYQGAVHLPSGQQERLAMNMTFAGGNITGLMGKGPAGPLPVPVDPLTGTMTGQHCTVTLGGANAGSVLDGSCDGKTFAGTYASNGVNMEFAVKNLTPVPAGCAGPTPPGPVPVPPPGPGPVPGPVPPPTPFPTPTPPVIRYCGTFTNTTVPFSGAFQIVLVTPNTFQGGTLLIGQPLTPTVGADFGGGGMSGDWASCSGVSDEGFRFLPGAVCSATTISGHYSIPVGPGQVQDGYFSSTATTAGSCPQ
jgi:hypothetical protein